MRVQRQPRVRDLDYLFDLLGGEIYFATNGEFYTGTDSPLGEAKAPPQSQEQSKDGASQAVVDRGLQDASNR